MNKKILLFLALLINIPLFANWQYKASMPEGRVGAVAVEYNDKIYIIGGKDNQNNYLTRVDLYDPVTDIWDTTSIAHINYGRMNAAVIIYNDSIFVIGGKDDSNVLDDVEIYLPAQNNWIEVHHLRREREGAFAVNFRGRPYVFGGVDDNGYLEDEVEWWDNSTASWIESTIDFNPPRASAFNFVWSDTLYVFGGFYFGPLYTSLKLATNGNWISGINLSQPRGNGTTVQLENNAFFIGGQTNTGTTNLVEIYNCQNSVLTSGTNLPEPRASHTSVIHDNIIYVFGGHSTNPSGILSTVVVFDASVTSIEGIINPVFPDQIKLHQNYPNPFNGNTKIRFELNKNSTVNISIYDVKGQFIKELTNNFYQTGIHNIIWNGKNAIDKEVSSGTYLVVLKSDNQIQKRKILYLK